MKASKRPQHVRASRNFAVCDICGARKRIDLVTSRWLARHRHGSAKFASRPLPTVKS